MVPDRTIIIEDRLKELFTYLPAMKNGTDFSFTPVFMYGNEKQLNDFLRQNNKGKSNYPLIWLVYPYVENHERSLVRFKNMTLILAVETNSVMLNDQRMEETYRKILIPLLDNIKKVFLRSNITNQPDTYQITKFPNYSNVKSDGDANKATYVWDAIRISFDGYITSNCLMPISM